MVSWDGVATDPEKVQAVEEWTAPKTSMSYGIFELGRLLQEVHIQVSRCGTAIKSTSHKGVGQVAVSTRGAAGI